MQESGLRLGSVLEGVGDAAVNDASVVTIDIYICFRVEVGKGAWQMSIDIPTDYRVPCVS